MSGETGTRIRVIVVMGVAGAGKTTVGRALSDALCWTFYDGDDFHPVANIEKMHHGHPLTDGDREPWLATLKSLVADVVRRDSHAVLACSALKESYRKAILPEGLEQDAMRYVFLTVAPQILRERLRGRAHFFPAELLDSQLSTLEEPKDAVRVDGARPVSETVTSVREALDL